MCKLSASKVKEEIYIIIYKRSKEEIYIAIIKVFKMKTNDRESVLTCLG